MCVQKASERVGLLTNSASTTRKNKISLKIYFNGEYLELVESFVYLGSVFTNDDSPWTFKTDWHWAVQWCNICLMEK